MVRVPRLAPSESAAGAGKRRDGAPMGATCPKGRVTTEGLPRRSARRPPSLSKSEGHETNLGRASRRENDGACLQ